MTDDPAWPLAQHVCRTGYADLPASAVERARRDIVDTFGCMLGGSGSPGIDELCGVIGDWGGRAESRVLSRGIRLPAPQAALLNASMGHALDFDDTLDTGGSIHPGVSVLAAALAMADRWTGPAGRTCCWLWHWGSRSRAASPLPAIGSRLAPDCGDRGVRRYCSSRKTARVDGRADAECVWRRLPSGGRQPPMHPRRRIDQRLQAGQAASAGVFAAGIGADRLYRRAQHLRTAALAFSDCTKPNGHDAALLLRDLGNVFCGEALSYKPYPCGRPLHAAIDAALAARAASDDRDRGHRSGTIEPTPPATPTNSPPAQQRRPTQVVEAQFAQPFLVATALVRTEFGSPMFDRLGDAAVLAL